MSLAGICWNMMASSVFPKKSDFRKIIITEKNLPSDGAMAGKIGPAGRHLQTDGCIRYVGTPGHRRTAQPRSGHSGLLFDRPDSTSGAPADDTTQSRNATAHR